MRIIASKYWVVKKTSNLKIVVEVRLEECERICHPVYDKIGLEEGRVYWKVSELGSSKCEPEWQKRPSYIQQLEME